MANQVLRSIASSSLDPLPKDIRNGMIAMGIVGLLSTISTLALFLFITYRMIYWKRFFNAPLARNQAFVLIYNLLLADLHQALSFLLSFWWISQNKLVGPNRICDAQGWLIQVGDVSSGLWVLAIAVHTFISLVAQKQVPHGIFVAAVCLVWAFVLALAGSGPARSPDAFFVPAGAWCWMGESHKAERLYLHYVWIFVSQLGSLGLYTFIFFFLRSRLTSSILPDPSISSTADNHFHTSPGVTTTTISSRSPNDPFAVSRTRILRTARYMVVYPFAYVALTLPLAAARVSVMAGRSPPAAYFPAAGTLMASCGFIDVLLYMWTRKALVKSSVGIKRGGGMDDKRFTSRSYGIAGGNRAVTDGYRMDGVRSEGGKERGIVVTKNVVMEQESGDVTPSPVRSERSDSLRSLVIKEGGKSGAGRVSWMA